eukprot:3584093-Rhodomonas_salina.2
MAMRLSSLLLEHRSKYRRTRRNLPLNTAAGRVLCFPPPCPSGTRVPGYGMRPVSVSIHSVSLLVESSASHTLPSPPISLPRACLGGGSGWYAGEFPGGSHTVRFRLPALENEQIGHVTGALV